MRLSTPDLRLDFTMNLTADEASRIRAPSNAILYLRFAVYNFQLTKDIELSTDLYSPM